MKVSHLIPGVTVKSSNPGRLGLNRLDLNTQAVGFQCESAESKVNGWKLETLNVEICRYMLISQLFVVQIRKQNTSKQPSVQFFRVFFCVSQQRVFNVTSMCVSQPQTAYDIFESIHIWLQKNMYRIMHHAYLLDNFNYF